MVLVPVLPQLQEQNRSWVPHEVTVRPQTGSWSWEQPRSRGFGWLRSWDANGEGQLLMAQELALE